MTELSFRHVAPTETASAKKGFTDYDSKIRSSAVRGFHIFRRLVTPPKFIRLSACGFHPSQCRRL
jgi:hypothetical protein